MTQGAGANIVLLIAFATAVLIIGLALFRYGESPRISAALSRLQDTTAQIRVRFAVVLFIAFAMLVTKFGLETILGAFVAGAMLKVVDRDAAMVHPLPQLLGHRPVRSELVYLLVKLDKEYTALPRDERWEQYYARSLLAELAATQPPPAPCPLGREARPTQRRNLILATHPRTGRCEPGGGRHAAAPACG